MGYYPVRDIDWPYDAEYFAKYRGYAATPMGAALNEARVRLAMRFGCGLPLLDVGIGCGTFLEGMWRAGEALAYGCDVNPAAVEWLEQRGRHRPWLEHTFARMTFWDSLEHLPDPYKVLSQCGVYAMMAIPIFRDRAHAVASKHFRPTEHYWYFTEDGLIHFMGEAGFRMVYATNTESVLGREDIWSYVFKRV